MFDKSGLTRLVPNAWYKIHEPNGFECVVADRGRDGLTSEVQIVVGTYEIKMSQPSMTSKQYALWHGVWEHVKEVRAGRKQREMEIKAMPQMIAQAREIKKKTGQIVIPMFSPPKHPELN